VSHWATVARSVSDKRPACGLVSSAASMGADALAGSVAGAPDGWMHAIAEEYDDTSQPAAGADPL
jgi:hypothetical protein